MRASIRTILISLALLCVVALGCERDDAAPSSDDEPTGQSQSNDVDDIFQERDDLVAYGDDGDIKLTVDDVEAAVERTRLVAAGVEDGNIPEGEPDWIQHPHAQSNLVRQLLHFQIVRHASSERDLNISAADETSMIADHDQLQRYLPLFQNGEGAEELRAELDDVGLDIDDVRHLAHDMILNDKLIDELADEFPDDQLWAIYQEARDTADVVVASLHNTPTSTEIDRAVDQYDRQIREYFRDNRDQFMRPAQLEATTLTSDDDRDVLHQAIEDLDDGDSPQEVADALGLELRTGVALSRHRTPEALDADIGDTGISESRHGAFVWQLDDRTDAERRSLDRPLRREIASQILRDEEGITPSNLQRAGEAQQIFSEVDSSNGLDDDAISDVVDELQQQDFEAVHTGHFSIRQEPRIPEIGLAENLQSAVASLDFDDPVSEPVTDRNQVHIARLIERNEPDRDSYEDERDEFREQFMERNKDRLLDQMIGEYRQRSDLQVSTEALVERFGVIEDKSELHDTDAEQPPMPDAEGETPPVDDDSGP